MKEAVQEVNPHSDLNPSAAPSEPTVISPVAVLVTTAHRGVFFGFAAKEDIENKALIRLSNCRNCLHWDRSIGGFLGLASVGPNSSCRIGAPALHVVLHDITSVTICSEEAVKAWTR